MIVHVVDACAGAKWFLPAIGEPLATEAILLLERFGNREIEIVVPDLFWVEVANVFWKSVLQKKWTRSEAESSLEDLLDKGIRTFPSRQLVTRALAIAAAHRMSLYDSVYVALAIEMKGIVVTADEHMLRAAGPNLPVQWLGSL